MTEPSKAQITAGADRLLMSHPSWFARLAKVRNRQSDEARYAAETLVEAVLRAVGEVES